MIRFVFFIFAGCCMLWACEPDNSLVTERKVVVDAVLYHDSVPRIHVMHSYPATEKSYSNFITHAEVRLYEDGVLVDRPELTGQPEYNYYWYEGTHISRRGASYRLEVDVPGYPTVYAETEIPEPVSFEIVEIRDASYGMLLPEGFITQREAWMIKIAVHDPPGDNYYQLYYHWLFSDQTGHMELYRLEPQLDPVFDRYQRLFDKEWIVTGLFNDQTFNGNTHILNYYLRYNQYNISDTLKFAFTLHSMNKDGYRFAKTAQLQNDLRGDTFSEPVQVYNNIRNGLGCFDGMSSGTAEVTAEFATKKFTVTYEYH